MWDCCRSWGIMADNVSNVRAGFKPARTITTKQIQKLDDIAINQFGIPSIALMENAGRQTAIEAIKMLKRIKRPKVCVVCGMGNNAGDGFVIARHLINAGIGVNVWLLGDPKKLKKDALINYRILKKCKYPIRVGARRAVPVRNYDLIIDAIFGVGLNRKIGAPFKNVIECINRDAKKILAVDIPSGLDGTTGKTFGVCIKANKTVTFSFAKKGFLIGQGPKQVGKIIVVDIGIPEKVKKLIKP